MENTNDMQPKEMHGNKMFIGVLLLVVFLISVVLLLVSNKKPQESEQNQTTVVPTVAPDKVEIEKVPSKGELMVSYGSVANVKKGQLVKVKVELDTAGTAVTGYDFLLSYDSASYEYKTTTTLNNAMRVSPFNNETYVTVTGFKAAPQATAKDLTGPVAELTFVAKVDNAAPNFKVVDYINNNGRLERTNFVDVNNDKFTPISSVKKAL
jgi:hypothetical protein